MKACQVTTVACIVPTETVDTPTYTIKQNGSELSATVDNENLAWKFDKVLKDTTLLTLECAKLCNSALNGYNAAYFSLSVSDGHRHDMNKQRNQTIQLFFDNLKTMIEHATVHYKIEYAFLGIQRGECYDIRKKIVRTNESMEKRDIDSIMKRVDCIDMIFNLVKERETTLPHLLSIKFTNPTTDAVGRLVLVDLMYSPFTPSVRDNTINSIQDIISALTTPKYTGLMQLGSCFIAKEISRYICGHNELLMVLHLNDRIINEIHSRDTLFLLSLVSSFTDMSVRSFPNDSIHNNSEYKDLVAEIKKLNIKRNTLEKHKEQLTTQLKETDTTINNLVQEKKQLEETIPRTEGEENDEQLDLHLHIKDNQVRYMETTLMARSFGHDFNVQQLKVEQARLNTMLDIKEFSMSDLQAESRRVELDYQQMLSELQQQIDHYEQQLNDLNTKKNELQETLTSQQNVVPPINYPIEIDEDEIIRLENEIKALDSRIKKSMLEKFTEQDSHKQRMQQAAEPLRVLEKENQAKIVDIKKKANERVKSLAEKLKEQYASYNQHIQNLRDTLEKEQQDNGPALKRRKVARDQVSQDEKEEEDDEEEDDEEEDEEEEEEEDE